MGTNNKMCIELKMHPFKNSGTSAFTVKKIEKPSLLSGILYTGNECTEPKSFADVEDPGIIALDRKRKKKFQDMDEKILILSVSAASYGVLHTIIGPDHYLPFIVMSKARNWDYYKTAWIT